MVVFFVVFGGFRALVTYENELMVEELDKAYVSYVVDYNESKLTDAQKTEVNELYAAAIEANPTAEPLYIKWDVLKPFCENPLRNIDFIEYGELATENPEKYAEMRNILANTYKSHLEGDKWLWVKNIFKSDTGTDVVPNVKSYTSSGAGGIGAALEDTQMHTTYTNLTDPAASELNKTGTWDFKKWNGYFILPLLSLLTSFLSTWIMQKNGPSNAMGTQEQQAQQQKQMKMMSYMMPIMLAVFAMLYSAAFAIYYFMSNVMATLTTLAVNGVMKLIDKRKEAQNPVIIR